MRQYQNILISLAMGKGDSLENLSDTYFFLSPIIYITLHEIRLCGIAPLVNSHFLPAEPRSDLQNNHLTFYHTQLVN